ncbi:MAG: site-specific DNA-methyltransferase [Rickettsiales bacterium]|jgi:modification methylase|nr:site-specific DNA-methyltransferase [Rickettsiales bacterium]
MEDIRVIVGDCIEKLKSIGDNTIDMAFADPPYNLQLAKKHTLIRPDNTPLCPVDDYWDKFDNMAEYDWFTQTWLAEIRRVLKPDGTVWAIGSYHNIFRVGTLLQNVGFWILNDIIWVKNNPMPNFRGTRFTNAHETLIWASKSRQSKYTFHYEAMKALNDGLQMRSDWWLPVCKGGERIRGEDGKTLHPTQKPEALLYRIILACTDKGGVVLDPFCGSGTTGAVAKSLGRGFIGIERDPKYALAAQRRIAAAKVGAALGITEKRRAERVAFGELVSAGIIKSGARLSDEKGRFFAIVQADGSVACGETRGSIHQVSAALRRLPSCNGWTFWFLNGKSIDELRAKYRDRPSRPGQGARETKGRPK